jgi:hypothetical protein
VFHVEDEGAKSALVAERPDLFFTSEHFNGYPAVLTRIAWLTSISRPEMEELVTEAWLSLAPQRLAPQLSGSQA